MKRALIAWPLFFCAIAIVPEARAEEDKSTGPSIANACAAKEHAGFDFWIGNWTVYGGKGNDKVQGRNRIQRSASGCWLTEVWSSASGPSYDGTSLNAWDAQYKVWRQFWTGADGTVLRLSGGVVDGKMIMTGELPNGEHAVQQQRITWTPNPDRSVTQEWETSDDAGASWKMAFRGTYRRDPE